MSEEAKERQRVAREKREAQRAKLRQLRMQNRGVGEGKENVLIL